MQGEISFHKQLPGHPKTPLDDFNSEVDG